MAPRVYGTEPQARPALDGGPGRWDVRQQHTTATSFNGYISSTVSFHSSFGAITNGHVNRSVMRQNYSTTSIMMDSLARGPAFTGPCPCHSRRFMRCCPLTDT